MSVNIQQPLLEGYLSGTNEGNLFVATSEGIVMASIDARGGNDVVIGKASGIDGIGISGGAINGGSGNDKITSTANSKGISDSKINGNSGADRITGRGSGSGSTGIYNSTINGSEGNDIITGMGAAHGISNSAINGGEGNDIIEANEIFYSAIKGNSGNDTFKLKRGIGTVNGGADEDRLILEGLKSDYAFTLIEEGNLSGNITSSTTNLNVSEVELFQFADNTLAFEELFV
jgi:hypothetical protein